MITLEPLTRTPRDFDRVVDEVAHGLGLLYGPEAEEDYRGKAHRVLSANLAHPAVYALAAREAGQMLGVLMGVLREPFAEISFLHVLSQYTGQGVEDALVQEAVRMFRAGGVEGILCESVPMSPIALDAPFAALDFSAVDRCIMHAPLDSPKLLANPSHPSLPFESDQVRKVADCIVSAYAQEPGTHLHPEVDDIEEASGFLLRLSAGNYGPTRPEYQRAVFDGNTCVGTIVGCQAAPQTGFVLQLVVRLPYRSKGVGTALLQGLASAFRNDGFNAIALGVTSGTPAQRIYEQAGLTKLRNIRAYVWRRP